MGANEAAAPDAFEADGRFDAAILAVGVAELVPLACRAVGKAGRVNLFAGFDQDAQVAIDPNLIHYRQLRITGASESRRRDYAEAMELVASGAVDPSALVTHRFPLDQYEEAFRVAADGSAIKVVFTI